MSPPYNYGHTFSPYSMNRAAMPEYPQFSTQRNGSYDHPFNRGPRITSLPGPFASSLLPFTPSMSQTLQHQHQHSHQHQHHTDGPPFEELSSVCSLVNAHQQPLNFDIIANIPKGFFQVEGKWTCYRRNYFSVTCGFAFKSHNADGRVFLQRHQQGNLEQVNGYAVSISAKTAAPNNSESEVRGLVQHTPKRDKATETVPSRQSVTPTPAVSLPGSHSMPANGLYPSTHMGSCSAGGFDGYGPAASQSPPTSYTFDRIQFQKATANNGKRRAQQQYFHVVVRLEVNIGRPGMQDDWVIVASRQSSPMVVRGRSPGHYKDTRRDSQTSMDPDAGSGHHGEGGGGMSGYALHPIGSSHSTSLGGAPGSYRHSQHYGTSFNHPTRRVEDSESSSNSRGSSVTLPSSPNKDDGRQANYAMNNNTLQGVCFDRIALSPMLGNPDAEQMDYHHSKKRGREEEHVEQYFQSGLDASTYNTPSFDFSATSSQALCASS
jgi:meiosis-specific transcription factor NDT80